MKLPNLFRPRRADLVPTEAKQIEPVGAFAAWRERMRTDAATKGLQSQLRFLEAVEDLWVQVGKLEDARISRRRAARRLERIDDIIALDDEQLDNELFEERQRGKDLRSKGKIRDWEREMEEGEAEKKYRAWKGTSDGEAPSSEPSQEAQELQKELNLVAEIRKAQAEYAAAWREAVQNAGGEENLTAEERENFRQMKAVLDQMIRDAGFDV